jgi:hypothetical protein
MANQSPDRREILEMLAKAAAITQFPGFSRWACATESERYGYVSTRPATYRPQFFVPPEYQLVDRLTELIIPKDESPGAHDAGAKVCALNGSRWLNPGKDFRNHKQPYDMPFRGFGDPKKRKDYIGYMDNEYTEGIWSTILRIQLPQVQCGLGGAALPLEGKQTSGDGRQLVSATSISRRQAEMVTT